jgi:hypothetical protein
MDLKKNRCFFFNHALYQRVVESASVVNPTIEGVPFTMGLLVTRLEKVQPCEDDYIILEFVDQDSIIRMFAFKQAHLNCETMAKLLGKPVRVTFTLDICHQQKQGKIKNIFEAEEGLLKGLPAIL